MNARILLCIFTLFSLSSHHNQCIPDTLTLLLAPLSVIHNANKKETSLSLTNYLLHTYCNTILFQDYKLDSTDVCLYPTDKPTWHLDEQITQHGNLVTNKKAEKRSIATYDARGDISVDIKEVREEITGCKC